ncbi:MAG: hypothetical protein A2W31_13105 [Planctomycetes bacterium RBG_16_64_10]|nr:MAG: hypothetical protein A2W31_13105 [Planctomycetes bacterium RBG_16_64_10]
MPGASPKRLLTPFHVGLLLGLTFSTTVTGPVRATCFGPGHPGVGIGVDDQADCFFPGWDIAMA